MVEDRFCWSCGASLKAGANFCASCGANTVARVPGTPDVDTPRRTLNLWWLGGALAIAVLLVAAVVASGSGQDSSSQDRQTASEPEVVSDLNRDSAESLLQLYFEEIEPAGFRFWPCRLSGAAIRDLSESEAVAFVGALDAAGLIESGTWSGWAGRGFVEFTPSSKGAEAISAVSPYRPFVDVAVCEGGTVKRVTGIRDLPEGEGYKEVFYEWTPTPYEAMFEAVAPYLDVSLSGLDEIECQDSAVFSLFDDGWRLDADRHTPACDPKENTTFGEGTYGL